MKIMLRGLLIALLAVAPMLTPVPAGAQQGAGTAYPGDSRFASYFPAKNYGSWTARTSAGSFTAGTYTITVAGPGFVTTPSGTPFIPFSVGTPIQVGSAAAGVQETVTPTAVSGCALVASPQAVCQITAAFSFAHGPGTPIISASAGLQEAINVAFANGGGQVLVDSAWYNGGGTTALITGAIVYPTVSIVDQSNGMTRNWNPTPTGAALAVPTTLTTQTACDSTHQTCSDSTVAGSASYAGGTLHVAIAYVDIMGNEGPASLDASFTDVSAKAIDIGSPAASSGAVGWVPYLSLDGGTYAQAYQITPTSAICTLTSLETVTPACSLANTNFGQVSSTFGKNALFNGGAQITGYPVNTGLHFTKLASVAMTAASLTPVSNSSVSYSYAPSNRTGACSIGSANVVNYAAAPSSATTIPNAIATWTIPAGCFNYIGAEFRVSGKFTFTDGGDTSTEVRVAWDAPGTNSTTIPTKLCSIVDTATGTAAAYNGTFYCSAKTATTGATGTALVDGYANLKLAAGATTLVRDSTDVAVAPSASINLTAPARVVVYFIGTGATNNPGAQGLSAKLEILN